MIVESLFHYQLIVDIYCYYIFIVFNTILVPVYKTSVRYLNYRIVKNIVVTTISFSLVRRFESSKFFPRFNKFSERKFKIISLSSFAYKAGVEDGKRKS